MSRLPLWAWAARDLARRPFETALSAAALFALTLVVATPMLLSKGIQATTEAVLSEGPSLVVRRLDSGGWAPMAGTDAVALALSVPGVKQATPRVWGVINGPSGPLTIQGVPASPPDSPAAIFPVPEKGEVIVGPGFADSAPGTSLALDGAVRRTLAVRTVLGPEYSPVLHDVVLTSMDDARVLLGLVENMASDLAIRVHRSQEESALVPDLARAFPYPVRIVTRSDYLAAGLASHGSRGAGFLVLAVPALLAMALLGLVQSRRSGFGMAEAGLCKALGWTTANLFARRWFSALILAVPSTALGLASAYGIVFLGDSRWLSRLLFGWTSPPPPLALSPDGAFETLLVAWVLATIPWFMGLLVPSAGTASTDPLDMIDGGGEEDDG